ncbi:hypothetical protein IEZ26_18295 [Nocardioides cavernae]|uniref:Uncharacterized protein n=1 Tax=Nocardioides cavernae TaxID=1921566 RepID=A0ABR8NI40_9ACTN|nr:hypothetical protein [Nocardioides cavernae]
MVRDFEKLSAILNAAEAQYPTHPLPLAYVGILNNRKRPRFNFDHLTRRLAQADIRPDVAMVTYDIAGPQGGPSARV